MSHATRHALRTISMSPDTLDELETIAALYAPDVTLSDEDLSTMDLDGEIDLYVE